MQQALYTVKGPLVVTIKTYQSSLAWMLCFALLVTGCSGQGIYIAAKTEQPEDASRTKVIVRLQEVGYSRAEALARTDKMTEEEIEYLAQHPEAVKRAGFIIAICAVLSSLFVTAEAAERGARRGAQDAKD